jgi:hypothetical protein
MESLECPNALAKQGHGMEVMERLGLSNASSTVGAPAW